MLLCSDEPLLDGAAEGDAADVPAVATGGEWVGVGAEDVAGSRLPVGADGTGEGWG